MKRRLEHTRKFVPDDVVAGEMCLEGLVSLREISVEVIALGGRQVLPRPIAASGRRRFSSCAADKHRNLFEHAVGAVFARHPDVGRPSVCRWAHRCEREAPLGRRR